MESSTAQVPVELTKLLTGVHVTEKMSVVVLQTLWRCIANDVQQGKAA
jgi:hypothetical protein